MSALAVDIGSSALAAVELHTHRDRVKVARTSVAPMPPGLMRDGEIVDADGLAHELRRFWKAGRFRGRRVRLGVANRRVVVRMIDLPAIDDDDERRAAVEMAVTEHLPLDAAEAVVDSQPVVRYWSGTESRERHMVVAAERQMINDLVWTVRAAGLQPVGIDLEAFAILRALLPSPLVIDEGSADAAAQLVCHIGADVTQVIVAVDRRCHFMRQLDGGGGDLTRSVADRVGLTSDEAEAAKQACGLLGPDPDGWDPERVARVRHALALGARPLVREIGRSLDYYRGQSDARSIERVVVSGGGALCTGLDRYLWQSLGIPVELGDPRGQVDDAGDLDDMAAQRVAVAMGLALDAPEQT